MALPIFPTSPLPATMDRSFIWGETATQYDSGIYQGSTPFLKPLTRFGFSFTNFPRAKQSSLNAFYNSPTIKGKTAPFLLQDPYDFSAAGGIAVRTGTNVSSFYLKTANNYPVFAQSGSLRITSALSGVLTQNSHYVLDLDTGIIVASLRPSSADFWTVTSGQFYKKCRFAEYAENGNIWESFSGNIQIQEIALP